MNRDTTKRLLTLLGIIVVIAIVAGYAIFASHSLVQGPVITITSPLERSFSTSTITIIGVAERVATITLNNRPIFIDEQGNFEETILLYPGYNVATLEGVDKFGKKTDISLQFYRNLNSF